jgi:hypothetical protein
MNDMLIFLTVLIVIELACAIGIYWALRRLQRWRFVLMGARVSIVEVKSAITDEMKHGRAKASQIAKALRYIEQLVPWWAKVLFYLARQVGKIKPQTS